MEPFDIKAAVARTINALIDLNGARGCAVWCLDVNERLYGFASEGEVPGGIDPIAHETWSLHRATLAYGSARVRGEVFLPVLADSLVGLVWISHCDEATCPEEIRGKLLRKVAQMAVRLHVPVPRPGITIARDDLVTKLEHHEWNISRVARLYGVTRRTIYNWLDKHEIPRVRIKKT